VLGLISAVRRRADWADDGRDADTRRRRPSTDQQRRFTSAVDLVRSPDHELGVLRAGVAHRQLSAAPTASLWARPPALIDRLPEGLDRVRRQRRFALVVDSPTAEYVTTRRPCDLYATEPFLDAVAYSFAIGRGAEHLRAAIDRQLGRLRRDSVLQQRYLHWWRTECAAVERWPRRRGNLTDSSGSRQRARQSFSSPHHAAGGGALRRYAATLNTAVVVVSAHLVTATTLSFSVFGSVFTT